jgi:hypothetical protein
VFACVGLWMALLTPVTVSLALKIRQIDPEGAAYSLARVLGLALLTVTAQEILSVVHLWLSRFAADDSLRNSPPLRLPSTAPKRTGRGGFSTCRSETARGRGPFRLVGVARLRAPLWASDLTG